MDWNGRYPRAPQAQCEGSQQKYKDLYGNPNKRLKFANHRNKRPFVLTASEALVGTLMMIGGVKDIFPIRKPCFIPLWVASFLCGYFPDQHNLSYLSISQLPTVL